jgi:transcriptional regulator with XRE-family HTH domain
LREARGWDFFDLSRYSAIGIGTLTGYEAGRLPSIPNLVKLAKAFQVSLGHFDRVAFPADKRHRKPDALVSVG